MFKSVKVIDKKNIKSFLLFIVIMTFALWFFMAPKHALNGSKFGMKLCLSTLIPSLFPFMVLSSLIVNLGFSQQLSFILGPFTKVLFKLPGETGATILLGFVGGYPMGASGIMSLLQNNLITKRQAERMAYFLVGAGPAFVVNFVGSQLLNNEKLGVILFISQVISSILIGVVIALFSKKEVSTTKASQEKFMTNFSQSLINSTTDAANNTINMCAFVILFSSFLEIIKNSSISTYLEQIFFSFGIKIKFYQLIVPSIFEVTNGMVNLVSSHASIFFLSFAIAWAGICVHFQIFYCLKDLEFSKIKFIIFRLFQGIISGLIAHIFICFFTDTIQVSIIKIHSVGDSFCNIAPSSFALILLCLCFLSTLTSKNVSFNDVKIKEEK